MTIPASQLTNECHIESSSKPSIEEKSKKWMNNYSQKIESLQIHTETYTH